MSSSSVCQGLQSCLEPRVIEPGVLHYELTPPTTNLSEEEHGFGFLQALSNNSHGGEKEKENKNEEMYVHPTVKCSSLQC